MTMDLRRLQTGYTLIELMVTIAILSIIIGVVMPGARGFINHSMLSKEVNELSALARLARFKAMEEQIEVVLCPTQDYSDCISNWTYAKMAFIDLNGDGDRDSDENLLGSTEKLRSSISVTAPNQSIIFDNRGGANITSTLIFCDETAKANKAVGLIINGYGKIAVAYDSDDNDIKEDHAGNDLSCS